MDATMSLHHLMILFVDLALVVVWKDHAADLSICRRDWATVEDMNQSSLLFDLRLLHRCLWRTAVPRIWTVTSFLSNRILTR